MNHLPPIISDLALILLYAGVTTLLFKRLRQPLVLGYVVAGILASQHIPYLPHVTDIDNIHVWGEIGVIFLLFSLGLHFSFKKLLQAGGTAVIGATTIMTSMMLTGISLGFLMGWRKTDALFLGGMIAMSSTTIIYKAFEDLGVVKKQFASTVLSILILEDILAIVLMVILSTVSVSKQFEGWEMIESILSLGFFLVIWFVVGLYLVPQLLRAFRKWLNHETLLVVAIGLCLGMVVFAAHVGFSPALGAFVMGSILCETIEADDINRLISPVKDLFAAVFFVSVGMMVNPTMLVSHAGPVLLLTVVVMVGMSFFGTLGTMLGGLPLKAALRCGFSLSQIGEFSFIIASLGMTLGVISDFLYPIVVAVSVLTTFATPYMIRYSPQAGDWLEMRMPRRWLEFFTRFSSGSKGSYHRTHWQKLYASTARILLIYTVICIAIFLLASQLLLPLCHRYIAAPWDGIACALCTVLCMAPFLQAIVHHHKSSLPYRALWADGQVQRGPLVALVLLRYGWVIALIVLVLSRMVQVSVAIYVAFISFVLLIIIVSRTMRRQMMRMEARFHKQLEVRERQAIFMGTKKPAYADRLITRDIHIESFEIPVCSTWAGKTFMQLNIGRRFGAHVMSILRGHLRIYIPGGNEQVFPGDKVFIVGTDAQLHQVEAEINQLPTPSEDGTYKPSHIDFKTSLDHHMSLRQITLAPSNPLVGCTVAESQLRETYHVLLVGIDRGDEKLVAPNADEVLLAGDLLWVVGEEKDLKRLVR